MILLSLTSLEAYSQDSIKLFYINKITLSKADSLTISQCKKTEYKTVSLEIYLSNKKGISDTIYSSATDYHWWKDSVIFSYSIPGNIYRDNASMIIHPIYHVFCTGLDGNRGTEEMEAEGTEYTVKNINIKFVSNPPGATVYLVPKMIWERTPALSTAKNETQLGHYILYNGTTPVNTIVQEYVYIVLFKYKNRFLPVECSPTHFKPVDSIYANFLNK